MSIVKGKFDSFFEITGDAQAAAILVLAEVLDRSEEKLSHNICMGIRHGLFGGDASSDSDIKKPTYDLSGSVEKVSHSLNSVAEALASK